LVLIANPSHPAGAALGLAFAFDFSQILPWRHRDHIRRRVVFDRLRAKDRTEPSGSSLGILCHFACERRGFAVDAFASCLPS